MMRKLVSIRRISAVRPIDGADAIEAVQIDGWQCVAKKGEFVPGDMCVYFEIDSFLPADNAAFAFMAPRGTQKNAEGREGYRLRTIKLRGTLSQGLALPIYQLFNGLFVLNEGDDVSEPLGITKWEPVMPACLSGEAKGVFPRWIRKTDQDRIQNLPDVLQLDFDYEVSIKLDGSSMTAYHRDGESGVCSRNLDLRETEGNPFWKVARRYGLPDRLADIGNVAIQGELVGPKIQGNQEKLPDHDLYVFDVWMIDEQRYATQAERFNIVESLGLRHVPILHYKASSPSSVEDALTLADGPSLNPSAKREGLVFKSLCGTVSWKAISNKWLLKHE
jgi:RNA ligase (TIGR02306 family)